MIATGTDIKPLEIVMFMRSVKSRNFFEQMKGRGVRVIGKEDFRLVTSNAPLGKTHFVIVDCVGVCEQDLSDTRPLERKRSVSFENLLQANAFGNTDADVLSSLASRLARLEPQLVEGERAALAANLQIEMEDFDYLPFIQRGTGRTNQTFGEELSLLLNELSEVLAA